MTKGAEYSLELFDVRGDTPLGTGNVFQFKRPVKAKESFEQFKTLYQVEAEKCEFIVVLNFEGNMTDLFAISGEGFAKLVSKAPASTAHYKSLYDQQPRPSIAEQRKIRVLYRRLRRLLPEREFNDISVVEEMLINASAVNAGFSRCSNCNLPVHIESKEAHRCVRCQKENLCNFCLTSHACTG